MKSSRNGLVLIGVTLPLLFASCVSALTASFDEVVAAYKQRATVPSFSISVPKVVDIPVSFDTSGDVSYLVSDVGSGAFIPSYVARDSGSRHVPQLAYTGQVSLFDSSANKELSLIDGNLSTVLAFSAFYSGQTNRAMISYQFNEPITTGSFMLRLGDSVTSPRVVRLMYRPLRCEEGDKDTSDLCREVILSDNQTVSVNSSTYSISFPETTAREFMMYIDYQQPLRIAEANFIEKGVTGSTGSLRFLAIPGASYVVYADPDRFVEAQYIGTTPDLWSSQGVQEVDSSLVFANNEAYRPSDRDGDSVPDSSDNCPSNPNTDQGDVDGNRVGDACEDYDKDGIVALLDNCKDVPNSYQEDTDNDSVGDVCDPAESRFLEAHAWVPWAAIIVSTLVILGLLVSTLPALMKKQEENA